MEVDSTLSDGPKAQAVDLPIAQGTVAVQGSSGASDTVPVSSGIQNAGSAASANQTPGTVPISVPELANVSAVNSAQLIQSVHHSEMRLGMQSDEFGSMSISTSVGRQMLSAQISTDHGELGRALALHLPAMEQKLSTAYGLPARVELNQGSSSSDTASSGQHPQGGRQQGNNNQSTPATGIAAAITTATYPVEAAAAAGSSRLDVRV